MLSPGSVYTLKLIRCGHVVPQGLQAALADSQEAKDVMNREFRTLQETKAWIAYEGVTVIETTSGTFHVVPAGVDTEPDQLIDNCCLIAQDTPMIDTL